MVSQTWLNTVKDEWVSGEGLCLPLHQSELRQHHWKVSGLQMCSEEISATVSSQPYQHYTRECFLFTWPFFRLCHCSVSMNWRERGSEWLITSGEASRGVSGATSEPGGNGDACRMMKRINERLLNCMRAWALGQIVSSQEKWMK